MYPNDSPGPPDGDKQHEAGRTTRRQRRLPFWRQMLSIVQASFGVQSRENRERDFESGSPAGFIIAAVIFTAGFVLALMLVVNLVISG